MEIEMGIRRKNSFHKFRVNNSHDFKKESPLNFWGNRIYSDEDYQFDPVCILALNILETLGNDAPEQWQINSAERIVIHLLKINHHKAIMVKVDENLPELKIVPNDSYKVCNRF